MNYGAISTKEETKCTVEVVTLAERQIGSGVATAGFPQ